MPKRLSEEELIYREKDKTYWRDSFKRLEQIYQLKCDDYAELAKIVGATPNAWFGDPVESHEEIMEMARTKCNSTQYKNKQ